MSLQADYYRQESIAQARVRSMVQEELAHVSTLDEGEKATLRECYVQKNSIASTAYKLNMSQMEVRMWYYRFSMMQMRRALLD